MFFPVTSMFQVDLVREVEAPSPPPEEAEEPEEPMETSQAEAPDLQEPADEVQDEVTAPEAAGGAEAAE